MRISDWSSDVCSSDLSLKEPSGRIRLDIGEPVVIDAAPAPDDKRALEKIAFAVAVEANRVTPLTVTSVMCLILLGMAPRGATRSEEHTSELQSLMRISYAVFCLKKKKKHKAGPILASTSCSTQAQK